MVIPTDDVLLAVAREAAEAAREILAAYYRSNLKPTIKGDGTPVTVADEEAEAAIAAVIRRHFPDHGFYGEETGQHAIDQPVVWLVDPLDGTKSFIRNTPFFSTQIAAMVHGELRAGVSCAPAFDQMACATASGPATLDGQKVRIREVALEDATVSTGNIQSLSRDPQRWAALGEVLGRANRTRGYGDFCHYHYLIHGAVDAIVESDVNILDIAALTVIVRSAGAVLTDLQGDPVDLNTRSVLAAAPDLHRHLLELLNA